MPVWLRKKALEMCLHPELYLGLKGDCNRPHETMIVHSPMNEGCLCVCHLTQSHRTTKPSKASKRKSRAGK